MTGAEQFSGASDFKILLGNPEAVIRFRNGFQTSKAVFGDGVADQNAESLMVSTSDPTSQLVELRQAESIGLLDDDRGGVGDIDADLDDRGGYKDIDFPVPEAFHHIVTLLGGQSPVHHLHCAALKITREKPVSMGVHIGQAVIRGVDHGNDDESLLAIPNPISQMLVDAL